MLFYVIALLVITLDQALKYLVHKSMFLGQSIPFAGNILKLTYVRNTGAAFSLFIGFSPYLAIVGIIVSLIVIYYYYRAPAKNYSTQMALAFILGGSVGNLIDRISRTYVIDYLDITVWPVFNLADVMINVGVIMLIYKLFIRGGEDVSRAV